MYASACTQTGQKRDINNKLALQSKKKNSNTKLTEDVSEQWKL